MTLQIARSLNFKNFEIPNLGALGQSDIWMQPPWLIIKDYKGGSGGFPQVWAMVNFVNLCTPMARLCTKNVPTTH
jgi:hypothetical protein